MATKLGEQAEIIQTLETQNITQAQQITFLNTQIELLKLQLAKNRRALFGQSSESFSPEQRLLFGEEIAIQNAQIETKLDQVLASVETPAPKAKIARPRAGRQPLPAHLPRVDQVHDIETCDCAGCGSALVKVGEDISEQLHVVPAKFTVIRHIRPQYACRACETMQAAPVAAAIIDGGMASTSVLAWVVVQKYIDHLPLHRIEQIALREGVVLAKSTLAEWVGKIGVRLQPLVDRLIELLLLQRALHADETPVKQLDPGKGKTKSAYLWAYRSAGLDNPNPIVVFDYQTSRSGAHARSFLEGWQGHLVVDDYPGYKKLFKNGVMELACWAHIRRKFFEVYDANKSPIAEKALAAIAQLYAIEADCRTQDVATRAEQRQQKAVPILHAMHEWLQLTLQTAAQNSATANVIKHTLKRWDALMRYAQSGDLPIDNNPIENSIRPIAIGKKNWLFTGSENAGERAAAIQTLFATAKANHINPDKWLIDTLNKLPTCPYSQIDTLLPLSTHHLCKLPPQPA